MGFKNLSWAELHVWYIFKKIASCLQAGRNKPVPKKKGASVSDKSSLESGTVLETAKCYHDEMFSTSQVWVLVLYIISWSHIHVHARAAHLSELVVYTISGCQTNKWPVWSVYSTVHGLQQRSCCDVIKPLRVSVSITVVSLLESANIINCWNVPAVETFLTRIWKQPLFPSATRSKNGHLGSY